MRQWKSHPATGNKLDECLNDAAKEGWEVFAIYPVGALQAENRLMPGQSTVMPIFTIVFYREKMDA